MISLLGQKKWRKERKKKILSDFLIGYLDGENNSVNRFEVKEFRTIHQMSLKRT